MNYELIKNELIKLKKEEFDYINNIAKISSIKILSEYEKLVNYRKLKDYENKLSEMYRKLYIEVKKFKKLTSENENEIIIEFNLDTNYLNSLKYLYIQEKNKILEDLGIDPETYKFKLTLRNLYKCHDYIAINLDMIQNNQKLLDYPIYIFTGYRDYSEEYCGPCFGGNDEYIHGIYINICAEYNRKKEILRKEIAEFENDNIIIHTKGYVYITDAEKIFEEELLNANNTTLNDCVIQTNERIEKLNYLRSPEYKEKILLEKINKLYKKTKGEFIKEETLYNGNFLRVLRETYRLPNENIVSKEKIFKNSGKNSVIVIAITQDKEYVITIQNRINDKLIAEFPSGYIENNEDTIDATKRELKEETGYISDDLFLVDEAYTSPGTDNSKTYIVIANNCIKTNEKIVNSTELVDYELFSEKELKYLINKNIINGAMNKLAYYNLINNVDDCNTNYIKSNKKIYKKLRKKINPLDNLI